MNQISFRFGGCFYTFESGRLYKHSAGKLRELKSGKEFSQAVASAKNLLAIRSRAASK